MKILRVNKLKMFSWDVVPDLSDFIPAVDETLVVNIEVSNLFQKQLNKQSIKLGSLDLKRLKDLRKDVRGGDVLSPGRFPDENVHILTGAGKGKNSDSLLVSKDINIRDRLTYRVYKLEHTTSKTIDAAGNETITKIAFQKVVLESCIGHRANGQGDYLTDPDIKEQFNRKRIRDNNRGRNTTN